MRCFASLILILLHTGITPAQHTRTVSSRNLVWGAAALNMSFNERWMLVSDALYRAEISDGDRFQTGVRAGVRYAQGLWQWTAGGAYFLHYPDPNGNAPRPEWRAWQEAGRKFPFGIHHLFYPRFRTEQRFISSYIGNEVSSPRFHSVRVRLRGEYFYSPRSMETSPLAFVVGDEIMFHYRGNHFTAMDQNRVWAGVQYTFRQFTVQLTYLYILQARNKYATDHFHVLRLSVLFNFRLNQNQ